MLGGLFLAADFEDVFSVHHEVALEGGADLAARVSELAGEEGFADGSQAIFQVEAAADGFVEVGVFQKQLGGFTGQGGAGALGHDAGDQAGGFEVGQEGPIFSLGF